MDAIYLKGQLYFWIRQHNLFIYILPYSIFKSPAVSYVYQLFYDQFSKQVVRCIIVILL